VGQPDVELRFAAAPPPEPLEEADIGRLHVGHHLHAAEGRRRRDGVPHQWAAQIPGPERRQDGQPVALPDRTPPVAAAEGVQPHRSAGVPADERGEAPGDDLDRVIGGVLGVEVGIGEDRLFCDEDLVPYPMVNGRLGGVGHRATADLRPGHQLTPRPEPG
jgi:hypothetical protein